MIEIFNLSLMDDSLPRFTYRIIIFKFQEEKFKIEADAILFSVRQKKSEANGQIQFLTALAKLHAARINAANAQNKPSLYDAVCGFNKIIGSLL